MNPVPRESELQLAIASPPGVDIEDIVRDSFVMRADVAQSIETVLVQQTAQSTPLRRLVDSHDDTSFTLASHAGELATMQYALLSTCSAITAFATAFIQNREQLQNLEVLWQPWRLVSQPWQEHTILLTPQARPSHTQVCRHASGGASNGLACR